MNNFKTAEFLSKIQTLIFGDCIRTGKNEHQTLGTFPLLLGSIQGTPWILFEKKNFFRGYARVAISSSNSNGPKYYFLLHRARNLGIIQRSTCFKRLCWTHYMTFLQWTWKNCTQLKRSLKLCILLFKVLNGWLNIFSKTGEETLLDEHEASADSSFGGNQRPARPDCEEFHSLEICSG